MIAEIIFLVTESDEGGFEARALGHSIFTEGDTESELRERVRDAVACHFEEFARSSVPTCCTARCTTSPTSAETR